MLGKSKYAQIPSCSTTKRAVVDEDDSLCTASTAASIGDCVSDYGTRLKRRKLKNRNHEKKKGVVTFSLFRYRTKKTKSLKVKDGLGTDKAVIDGELTSFGVVCDSSRNPMRSQANEHGGRKSCLKTTSKNWSKDTLGKKCHREAIAISFDKVEVREYERALGDNPCVRDMGAPLSLGWSYISKVEFSVDKHQHVRSMKRRNKAELFVPSMDRDEILADWGYNEDELYDAIKEVGKVRFYREKTLIKLIADGKLGDVKVGKEMMTPKAKIEMLRREEAQRKRQTKEQERTVSAQMSQWRHVRTKNLRNGS